MAVEQCRRRASQEKWELRDDAGVRTSRHTVILEAKEESNHLVANKQRERGEREEREVVLGWRDTQVSQCELGVSRCDEKGELKEFSVKSACKGLGLVRTPWSSQRL